MDPTIDPDEIQAFLRAYPSREYSYAQAPYLEYGSPPAGAQTVTSGELILDDAGYSEFDAQSEYTTASTETYTRGSVAPSSIFSRGAQSSAGQSSVPSIGGPHLPFAQQFAAGPAGHGTLAHGNAELWCEFSELKHCRETFRLDDGAGWIAHHARHLRDSFPARLMCWFCDHVPFVAARPAEAFANFEERMQHIQGHIFGDHRLTSEHTRPDFYVVRHLHRNGLLDDDTYRHAMAYDETPAIYRLPGSHSSSAWARGQQQQQQAPPPHDRLQYHRELEARKRAERRRDRERRGGRRG
ncbi:hypothetical protein BT67DRAFT_256281 [Trichocladium antarcticum]|uniref:Uncharacterized protein n=1 Tax=Trichocladium antarcticum TaxID=1450529 RepID=A0AAN6ZFJ8_9PEZI|nr:hypothetical protein BT67DRAFT_256281 [Trichocladium antarcticum]